MAATCAGVNCFGAVAASSQKPRALMMSAGVCGFASALSADDACASTAAACFAFGGWTLCTSADASWNVEAAAAGFARGIGTGWLDLAGRAAAIRPAEVDFWPAIGAAAPSSPSSFDLPLNNAANRLGLLLVEASPSLPRFSMLARASSYPISGLPSEGRCTGRPSGNTRANWSWVIRGQCRMLPVSRWTKVQTDVG